MGYKQVTVKISFSLSLPIPGWSLFQKGEGCLTTDWLLSRLPTWCCRLGTYVFSATACLGVLMTHCFRRGPPPYPSKTLSHTPAILHNTPPSFQNLCGPMHGLHASDVVFCYAGPKSPQACSLSVIFCVPLRSLGYSQMVICTLLGI